MNRLLGIIKAIKAKEVDKRIILIAVATIAIAFMYGVANYSSRAIDKEDLRRPDYDGYSRYLDISVREEGGESIEASIVIEPRKYSWNNIEKAFDELYQIIDKRLLAKNESIDMVNSELNFMSKIDGYPMTLQWLSSDYGLVDYSGRVHNEDFLEGESEIVILTCVAKYEGWTRSKDYTVRIVDVYKEKSKQERMLEYIRNKVASNPAEEYAALPVNIDGIAVSYMKKVDWNTVLIIIILGCAAIAVIVLGQRKQREEELKKREKELKRDYSEMIHKLALLMGAGMTVRMAFEHIAMEYHNHKKLGKVKLKPVYEEMWETCNHMRAGASELNAYAAFGSRCNTKEYLKFSSLIIQNLKKGSRQLVELLELEAIDAFEERKNIARKYGEEAGTKLLLPMVVMLLIVMAIIMVPAIVSFG